MRILAVDPGYEKMGVAVLEKQDRNNPRLADSAPILIRGKETLLFSECFKTSSKTPHSERLQQLGGEVKRVIEEFKPECLAIEKLFFTTNQKTAMRVSEARGVIVYEASLPGLSVFEYTPLQIKIAVTGYGRSDKRQVTEMVKKLIALPNKKRLDDEYDAIALGLTYFACEKRFSMKRK